jgi:hypothetical protein
MTIIEPKVNEIKNQQFHYPKIEVKYYEEPTLWCEFNEIKFGVMKEYDGSFLLIDENWKWYEGLYVDAIDLILEKNRDKLTCIFDTMRITSTPVDINEFLES